MRITWFCCLKLVKSTVSKTCDKPKWCNFIIINQNQAIFQGTGINIITFQAVDLDCKLRREINFKVICSAELL